MTDDFIKASVTAGILACEIDKHLADGRGTFATLVRAKGMAMSWEYLEEVKALALAMGVPAEVLEIPAHFARMIEDPEFNEFARQLQVAQDRRRAAPNN
jgi:hypothetical protein